MGISNISNGWRPGICTSTTRPTAPYEGQMIYETDTDKLYIYNGSAWRHISTPQSTETGAYTSYTPTWTSSGTAPNIGDGVLLGKYTQINKVVHAEITLITGATTTFGTGIFRFSLPVTAKTPLWNYTNIGMGRIFDASTGQAYWTACLNFAGSTTYFTCTSQNGSVSAAAPMTWGVSDELTVQITYEAA